MILGRIYAVSWALVMIITFMMAYSSPHKAVIVSINDYGEANLELVMIILGFPLMVWNFLQDLKICARDRSPRSLCSLFRSWRRPMRGKHGKRRADL